MTIIFPDFNWAVWWPILNHSLFAVILVLLCGNMQYHTHAHKHRVTLLERTKITLFSHGGYIKNPDIHMTIGKWRKVEGILTLNFSSQKFLIDWKRQCLKPCLVFIKQMTITFHAKWIKWQTIVTFDLVNYKGHNDFLTS